MTHTHTVPVWGCDDCLRADKIQKAANLAQKTGKHVDHIVPLIHPLVCGINVETNLQLLTPFQNFSKNNRWPWTPK